MSEYRFVDSGFGQKLEAFGEVVLIRPCQQAVWAPKLLKKEWDKADALFTREGKKGWEIKRKIPSSWIVEIFGMRLKASLTDFGHVGIFPEHKLLWDYLCKKLKKDSRFLNLFAYSGAATLCAAKTLASVCHVDASKPMVAWARENAAHNQLEKAQIRWIVDDAVKFMKREHKRGSFYDGILLDPPTFGRGPKKEVFKIEEEIVPLLHAVFELKPSFVLLTSHTPGFTPTVLSNLLGGSVQAGEILLEGNNTYPLPSGSYAIWEKSS